MMGEGGLSHSKVAHGGNTTKDITPECWTSASYGKLDTGTPIAGRRRPDAVNMNRRFKETLCSRDYEKNSLYNGIIRNCCYGREAGRGRIGGGFGFGELVTVRSNGSTTTHQCWQSHFRSCRSEAAGEWTWRHWQHQVRNWMSHFPSSPGHLAAR